MGKAPGELATYRKRLIKAGLIEASSWGKVRFTIPGVAGYLCSHREQIEQEIAGV